MNKLKMKFLPAVLLSIVLLCAAAIPSAVSADADDWPQFQKDESNSGVTSSQGPVSDITLGWRQPVAYGPGCAGIDAVPLVAEGMVFTIDSTANFWAFDAKTGDEIWHIPLSYEGFTFQLATPAYDNGRLFVATNDGHVYALNSQTGSIIWEREIAGTFDQLNTPVTCADGKVYVGRWSQDSDGAFYCLDADTGVDIWTRASTSGAGYYWAGGCIIGDYFVYGDGNDCLVAVDRNSGNTTDELNLVDLPYAPTGGDQRLIRSSVTWRETGAGNGYVLVSDFSGSMGALGDGYLWKVGFDSNSGLFDRTAGSGWNANIGYSTSTPVFHDGKIYVGSGNYAHAGKLFCFDETGNELWHFDAIGGVESSPSITCCGDDVHIYFTANCDHGTAYCLDDNGNECWQFTTYEAGVCGGYVLQGLAISDGWAYFGNDGEYLYALTTCPDWDVNMDGNINIIDIGLVSIHWGETGTPGWIREDVNGDGVINIVDIGLISTHWGE